MNYRHHDIEAKLAGEADLASRVCCGTKRSDSRKQPPVTTPSLSLDVIEFPLICCKLAAFFHLLFFSRRQIITVDTWKVTQKNDDASRILNYLFRSLLFTLILAFLNMNESPIDRASQTASLSHSF